MCFSLRLCIRKCIVFWKRLFCVRKFRCILKKTDLYQEISLCSWKDSCVLEKIVVFSKRLLCSRKDFCVLEKIAEFQKGNWVVFCPYGPPKKNVAFNEVWIMLFWFSIFLIKEIRLSLTWLCAILILEPKGRDSRKQIVIFKKVTTCFNFKDMFRCCQHHRQLQNIWKTVGLYNN